MGGGFPFSPIGIGQRGWGVCVKSPPLADDGEEAKETRFGAELNAHLNMGPLPPGDNLPEGVSGKRESVRERWLPGPTLWCPLTGHPLSGHPGPPPQSPEEGEKVTLLFSRDQLRSHLAGWLGLVPQPEARPLCPVQLCSLDQWFPGLGPPVVLGLQLPEILASRGGGEGFWEL